CARQAEAADRLECDSTAWMCTTSNSETWFRNQWASPDEYLNDSLKSRLKNSAGAPCHAVGSPTGTFKVRSPSAFVVTINVPSPVSLRASHMDATAPLGPPYREATAGMTWSTRMCSVRGAEASVLGLLDQLVQSLAEAIEREFGCSPGIARLAHRLPARF